MELAQSRDFSDRGADRDGFDVRDLTDDLEIHQASTLGANVCRRLTSALRRGLSKASPVALERVVIPPHFLAQAVGQILP